MAQEPDYTKRSGKYRHIYGDLAKPEKQFLEIPSPLTSGEGPYVKASAKFFAFAGGSVQKLYVKRLDDVGRFSSNEPHVALDCLKGKIWDFSWNPFIDTMIAMGDDNGKVAVAQVPKDGLKENLTSAAVDLGQVHGKKVTLVEFHPSAASILATGSFDRTVQLYNIETQAKICSFDKLGDNIYSLQWNKDGSQLATTSKDKKLRIFDPRNMEDENSVQVINAFEGTKSSKVFFIPRLNWIGATGFSKQAKRELKLWDLRDISKPLYANKIDQASSVLMPHWDDDNGVLYLPGKGEGTVQFGEIINDNKRFYPLGAYRNPDPQKGGGWVPKRALDVWKCEVQRFLKLTSKAVRPISFIVPRKAGADVFQEDIYPDCLSAKPAMTADEWINGENKDPNRMSMDPKQRSDDGEETAFVAKKSYAELEKENAQLKKRLKELEAKLGISSDDNNNDNNGNNEDAKEDDPDATMTSADTGAADDAADDAE